MLNHQVMGIISIVQSRTDARWITSMLGFWLVKVDYRPKSL